MSAKLLGLASLLALGLGLTAPAVAQQGMLTLVDRRLSPGATVKLMGAQFPPASRVALALEGASSHAALSTVTTGPDGAFSESLRVPGNLAPGAYRLVARAGTTVASLDVAILADTAAAAPLMTGGEPQGAPMAGMSHAVPTTGGSPQAAHMAGVSPAAPMPPGMPHAATEPRAAATGSRGTATAPARPGFTILGYDWPRLHAALNDLPAALLLVSVLFDLFGAVLKREDFRTVGFWTLMVGVLGTGAAVIAGLKAEASVEHSDEAHAIMEVHQTMGLIVLGVFGILALWRLARRRGQSPAERTVANLVGLVGLGILVRTAQLGGKLMFDHALGIPTARLHVLEGQRESEEHEHGAEPAHHMVHDSMPAHNDTLPAHADSTQHEHSHQ